MLTVDGRFTEGVGRLGRCPVVLVTGVLAVGVSVLWWSGRDIGLLFDTPEAVRGEPWRLLTSALPHVNILHLVFNLYWLVFLGTAVETSFGSAKTLGLFALMAAASASWQMALSGGGVGLSGVGYGLFGMLWVLERTDPRYHGAVDRGIVEAFVGWFVLCCILTWTGFWNVGNAAHAAGAVAGALVGAAASRGVGRRAAFGVGAALFLAGGILWVRTGSPGAPAGSVECWRGIRALQEGRTGEAEPLLRRACDLDPGNGYARYNLGVALQRQSRWAEALAAFREAARLIPENGEFRKVADDLEAWMKAAGK